MDRSTLLAADGHILCADTCTAPVCPIQNHSPSSILMLFFLMIHGRNHQCQFRLIDNLLQLAGSALGWTI